MVPDGEALKIQCKCGASHEFAKPTCNLGEQVKESGFSPVWDTSDGPSTVWLCPKHAEQAKALLSFLQDLFPVPLRYLNFNPLLKDLTPAAGSDRTTT